jgi:hypothetical protein
MRYFSIPPYHLWFYLLICSIICLDSLACVHCWWPCWSQHWGQCISSCLFSHLPECLAPSYERLCQGSLEATGGHWRPGKGPLSSCWLSLLTVNKTMALEVCDRDSAGLFNTWSGPWWKEGAFLLGASCHLQGDEKTVKKQWRSVLWNSPTHKSDICWRMRSLCVPGSLFRPHI